MKILSVNIEDKKHIPKITALIARENPDVVCMQEICEKNLADFAAFIPGAYSFVPMAFKDTLDDTVGIAVFTTLPVTYTTHILKESDKTVTSYSSASFEDRFRSQSYYTIEAVVTGNDGAEYRIYNTHLPVTEAGETTDFQLSVIEALLAAVGENTDIILMGDSNAPRGGEAFAKIAAHYKDNIPEHYTTSIDGTLHRNGPLERMVDILFSTSEYTVENVRFINGVSDHCAVTAELSRK
jgi:endonuclease/exonuclease/phosphatase family metal-dependent hydrolase